MVLAWDSNRFRGGKRVREFHREPRRIPTGDWEDSYGQYAFYEVKIGTVCEILPRFFIGPTAAHLCHFNAYYVGLPDEAAFLCTDDYLCVRLGEIVVCHFALFANGNSQPCYDDTLPGKLWAVSGNHRYHAHFRGQDPNFRENLSVFRECAKYARDGAIQCLGGDCRRAKTAFHVTHA
jgi:hypothetical protein